MTTADLDTEPASILVFARTPEPGKTKTRLIPRLGAKGAAVLAERLIERTMEMLSCIPAARIQLWTTPDNRHPLFERLSRHFGCALREQQGQDLGARLWHAVSGSSGPVILIGTDCPAMTPAYLSGALQLLERQDAVLGPASDGGYVLLGLQLRHPALFDGIPWGSDSVAAMTRERLDALGWRWSELETLPDLDRPEDLDALNPALCAALGLSTKAS